MSNRTGLGLIKESEGLRLKAYLCPAGIPTIGYGETENVKLGDTCTEEWAETTLEKRYDWFEAGVKKLVTVPLTEGQLGALTSFSYNLGLGSLQHSTLLKLLNSGAPAQQVAEEFGKWNKAAGHELPGLTIRRAAEAKLFLS